MSNKTAKIKITCSYHGVENEAATLSPVSVTVPYQGQSHGTIDVPDTTAGSTTYDIPFGSIASATGVIVENKTGQDLWLKWNSANIDSHKQYLPDGAAVSLAFPAVPGSFPTTAVSVTTTGTQAGAGLVAYHVFGDPV